MAPHSARNVSEDQLSPEQQLEAQQQFLKIFPYILGFGWIVMIPISYFFIAPAIVEGFEWQLLVAAGVTIATGVADFAFYKIFANSVVAQAQHLEQQSSEVEQDETIQFGTILS